MAKTFKKSYIPKKVDSQVKETAKQLFIDQSMVIIVGPTGSGKTSLSFELLPLYDLSNGEDNFIVISDPSELKFVNLSLHPVVIIKSLCGVKFNHAEAHKWYSQLDRLYAAVKINQIAVIITIESKVCEMIQSHMPPHPLLAHTVKLTSSSVNESEKRSKEKFKRSFVKPFNGFEFYQDRIKLITKQLNENHRVIVTGNENDLNYKCAFAAIIGANQCIDQCLEINNPSDWGSITYEDAKLVLFNEPFGRFIFDERKYEAMLDEIDGMLNATLGEDDDAIDIVIVTIQKHLKEATDRSDHDMFCTSSIVEIDSSNIDVKGFSMLYFLTYTYAYITCPFPADINYDNNYSY